MVLGFLMNCLLHGFTLRCMADKGRTEREMFRDLTQCNQHHSSFILKLHGLIRHSEIHFKSLCFHFITLFFKFQFKCNMPSVLIFILTISTIFKQWHWLLTCNHRRNLQMYIHNANNHTWTNTHKQRTQGSTLHIGYIYTWSSVKETSK